MKKLLLFLLLLLIFASCGPKKIYEKYIDINNYLWSRETQFDFNINIENIENDYDIFLEIRHTLYYIYDNLALSIIVYYPNGEIRIKDYNIKMRDSKGTFYGDGMGDIFDRETCIMKNIKFPEKGLYKFKIQNIMPRPVTGNIMQIGFVVKQSKEKLKTEVEKQD